MTEQEVKDLIGETVTLRRTDEACVEQSITGVIVEITVRLDSGRYWVPGIAQVERSDGKK